MPTYDYVCKDCGYQFEAFQKMSDEPLSVCPQCNGEVKRKIGAGLSPIFKGSGFYVTDYKNAHSQQSAPATKNDSSPAKNDTAAKSTDSKKAV